MKEKYQIQISPEQFKYCDELDTCYPWWQKFVNTVFADYEGDTIEGNAEWEAYQEKVFTENKITYVSYTEVYCDSEADFTWFLLKWS